MRCPACAQENRDVDRFCTGCGARLELICLQCGAAMPAGARFCGSCGAPAGGQAKAAGASSSTATAPDGERRQLTVLFCDLADSTALSARLDPEELRSLLRAYQDVCAAAVARFNGHIAQYLGDGVLVYFGFPQAHEDDSIRAVRTALAITAAMRSLPAADLPAPDLAVRVGIHTGLVVVGEVGSRDHREQLALGETPNLAARLQGLAPANGVVISAAT